MRGESDAKLARISNGERKSRVLGLRLHVSTCFE